MTGVRRITLPYAPRSVFNAYHERVQRWACLVAHRRCGKTVACINDTIKRGVTHRLPHGRFAYVAPFLAQAKEVAWDYLKRYAQPIIADKNEGELWVELVNGARIRIHGADNPDRLRGQYLDGVVLDEFADMRPSVWGEIIRPMLMDRAGWATFIGTPKGRNQFWEIYDGAANGWPQPDGERFVDPDWVSWMLRASETGLLPEAELDKARREMTPEQYQQELECSFDAAILGAYFGKEIAQAERDERITEVAWDEALPVHTAWDLGISKGGNTMAIWCWQINGTHINVIDYYGNNSFGFDHYFEVLNEKPYRYETDWLPPDARARETSTGRTRVEYFASARRFPRIVPEHTIADRINASRLTLPRCRFDRDRCRDGIEALRQYRTEFDERLKTFTDRPLKNWASHPADAFGALSLAWRELVAEDKPADPIAELLKPRTLNEMIEEYDRERAG